MQIFAVRDAQIRLILLEYFVDYMNFFSLDELTDQLLPQLLVGIKDTNDILVAATLRCLAELVPILGSAVVIGKNRGRYFADGRPQGVFQPNSSAHWIEHRSITPVMNSVEYTSNSPLLDHADLSESYVSTTVNLMPVRLSPDGGEDVKSSSEVLELEDDAWSDWEAEATESANSKQQSYEASHHIENTFMDVKELDIKTKRRNSEEIDFFKDMEPVIHRTNVLLIAEDNVNDKTENESNKFNSLDKSRLDIKLNECEVEETGWGDDGNDWE